MSLNGRILKIETPQVLEERFRYWAEVCRRDHDWAKPLRLVVQAETRSDQQNNYLWGWLYRDIEQQLADAGIVVNLDDGREFPYTKELLHDIFKDRFLCKATLVRNGKERKLYWSTTELLRSPKDTEFGERPSFSWYVDQVKALCAQVWDIHVPDPPPRSYSQYPELMDELRRQAA